MFPVSVSALVSQYFPFDLITKGNAVSTMVKKIKKDQRRRKKREQRRRKKTERKDDPPPTMLLSKMLSKDLVCNGVRD
jgi:hypothetical protein